MTSSVPEWCGFFSVEQYGRFVALLRAELARRGQRAELHLEDGYADVDLPGDLQNRVGLVGLAQNCHPRPESDWELALMERLSSLDRVELDPAPPFDSIRERLRVRLYPDPYGDHPDQTVHRLLTSGINLHPVIDSADKTELLLRRHLRHWGKTEDEVFELGTDQARRHERLAPELIDLGNEIRFHTIRGNSFLVSANALWLDEYVDRLGLGALVALPNRHELIFHEIVSLQPLLRTHTALPGIVRTLYEEGPGSISPEIYWWHSGTWTHLPLEQQDRSRVHLVPREFVEAVINPLKARG